MDVGWGECDVEVMGDNMDDETQSRKRRHPSQDDEPSGETNCQRVVSAVPPSLPLLLVSFRHSMTAILALLSKLFGGDKRKNLN